MPQQCKFTDPASGDSYTFTINPAYDAETKAGTSYMEKARQIERTSNTGNIGATQQQGDDGTYVIHWEWDVFSYEQELALWQWYRFCKTQSIYLTDFNGDVYEGQITLMARQRSGAVAGPQDTNLRKFFSYVVMEFSVWNFLSGVMADAGVTP